MNFDHRNPRLRRGFAFVALAAVLGLSAVGLTQCRLVDDTVTGVDLKTNSAAWGHSSGRSRCVHQCNEKYKQCRKAEEATHKANLRSCGNHDNACKKAEDTRHKNALKECVRQMQLCKKGCRYREGAGSAGR
jgi:hypothetical protein